MDYLARESAPFSSELWAQIDDAAIGALKKHLVCRRFLNLFGPLGAGASMVPVDGPDKEEILDNGIGRMSGRRQVELPLFYEDFLLSWRDIEEAEKNGYPLDLSSVRAAAKRAAKREDELILYGNDSLSLQGLMNASGSYHIKMKDWNQGENAFINVAEGISHLFSAGCQGRKALVVSPDLYLALQRLQQSAGMLESDRIKKLIDGHILPLGDFGTGKAVLVCAEPEYMDLALGMDFSIGYSEMKDFNHVFRLMETAALRIKNPEAIVVFE